MDEESPKEDVECSIITLMARLTTAIEYHIDSLVARHQCNVHGDKEVCKEVMSYNNKAVEEYDKFKAILWGCLKKEKK